MSVRSPLILKVLPGNALGVSLNLPKMPSGAESRDVVRPTPRCLAVSGTTCSITSCLANKIGQSGSGYRGDCQGMLRRREILFGAGSGRGSAAWSIGLGILVRLINDHIPLVRS